MVFFAADLAADQEVAQGRGEGDAEQRRGEHDEGLGVGEWFEEAAGLALEAEDGDEGDGDDQQGEEDRGGDLAGGGGEELAALAGAHVFGRVLEALVAGLDHDDLGVDGGADGDGDAAEAHDRGRDAEPGHRDEGE